MSWYKSCSFSLARAFLAMVWKACSTFTASLALVSKYGTSFFSWHHCTALLVVTLKVKNFVLYHSISFFFCHLSKLLLIGYLLNQLCFQWLQMGSFLGLLAMPGLRTRLSSFPSFWRWLELWHRIQGRSSLRLDKMQRLNFEIFLVQLCPKSWRKRKKR